MKKILLIPISVLLLSSGCIGDETVLDRHTKNNTYLFFESIAHGYASPPVFFSSPFIIISNSSDWEAFISKIPQLEESCISQTSKKEICSRIPQLMRYWDLKHAGIDFEDYFVIGACCFDTPVDYKVTITKIHQIGNEIHVTLHSHPGGDVVSNPYHLVKVRKVDLIEDGNLTFIFKHAAFGELRKENYELKLGKYSLFQYRIRPLRTETRWGNLIFSVETGKPIFKLNDTINITFSLKNIGKTGTLIPRNSRRWVEDGTLYVSEPFSFYMFNLDTGVFAEPKSSFLLKSKRELGISPNIKITGTYRDIVPGEKITSSISHKPSGEWRLSTEKGTTYIGSLPPGEYYLQGFFGIAIEQAGRTPTAWIQIESPLMKIKIGE